MNKSSDFLNCNNPVSGLSVFSFLSCFFVPTAPSKIASESLHCIEVFSGNGTPELSIAMPPISP